MITISTFHYNDHPVRIVEVNGKDYFVVRDICDIIKLSNPNRALALYTDNVPFYNRLPTPGGLQVVRLVPAADVSELLYNYDTRACFLLNIWLICAVFPVLNNPEWRSKVSVHMATRKNSRKGKHHGNR